MDTDCSGRPTLLDKLKQAPSSEFSRARKLKHTQQDQSLSTKTIREGEASQDRVRSEEQQSSEQSKTIAQLRISTKECHYLQCYY